MGVTEKSGVGGLSVAQNDMTDRGLELHAPLEMEVGLMEGSDVVYQSVSPIDEQSTVIEFVVPRDNECSFILNQSRLSGYFIVTTDSGETGEGLAATAADYLSIANHYAACLFKQIEVYLNGTQVCDLSMGDSYPYKMYIQSLLSYNSLVKNSYLETEGYTPEMPIECGIVNYNPGVVTIATHPGLFNRKSKITGKKKVYFNTRIGADIFYTDRFLPPNVDIKIKLIRHHKSFGLLYTKSQVAEAPNKHDFKILLKNLKLHMRKVLPTMAERDRYQARMLKTPCYLPYQATRMRQFTIPSGISSYIAANVVTGILPKKVIFCMISTHITTNNRAYNPFNFQHNNLTGFNLKRNGQNVFPRALEMDIDNGNYVDMYRHMYENLGVGHGNQSFGVNMDHFLHGKFFLVADLNPDRCNSYHVHPDVYGNLDVELTFKANLTEAVTLLAYMIYNSGIKIDQFQQVTKGSE